MTSQRRRLAARRRNKETGSLSKSEPDFVLVGILRRPHGLRGEALVSIDTDFPERLQKGKVLYLGEDQLPVTIRSRRGHNEGILLAFQEFPDKESLQNIRNLPLYARIEDIPKLPAGEYYRHQLIGLEVVEENGEVLGILVQVLDTSANDVYIVQSERGEEILLPATKEVIRGLDQEKKLMTVRLLPGLRPESD